MESPSIFTIQTGFISKEDVIKIASSNAWDKSQPTFVLVTYQNQTIINRFNEFHVIRVYDADPYSKTHISNGTPVRIFCTPPCFSDNQTNRFAWDSVYADSITRCYAHHYIDAITGKVIGYQLPICF